MAVANVKNIYRVQGDTYPVDVTVLQSDGVTPYDLTGVTEIKLGISEFKALEAPATPLWVVTGTLTVAVDGTASFPITGTEADITAKKYWGEIQFIDAAASIITTDQFEYHVRGQIIL